MTSAFYVGMPGPTAVAQLNSLWDRVSGLGTIANGGVTLAGGVYTLHVDLNYRVYDLGSLTANSQVGISGGSSLVDGKTFFVRCKQDATGGRTLTPDSTIALGTDLTPLSISGTANKKSYFGLAYDDTTGKADLIAQARGY